jgi:recombination protein RecT
MAETTLQKTYKDKAAAQQSTLPAALTQTMAGLMPQIPALLPPDIPVEQFRAALYLELSGRPGLAECTRDSLRDCVIKAATYGLLPGRDCHVLPFKNRKGNNKLATYVPNYFGLILALERTGKVAKAFAHPVYSGDEFVIDYLADVYKHVPAVTLNKPPGPLRFFYGCVRLKDGTTHIEVMDEAQIDAVRRRAPAHDSGPWVDDYLMMARKTALKRVVKYVRLTPEQQGMLADDDDREREDIPDARHRQNIVDLFGKEPEDDPAAHAKPVHSSPKAPTQDRDSAAWDTLRAHMDDARLPEELLERIQAALSPLAPANDTEAHDLASTVLDCLNNMTEE